MKNGLFIILAVFFALPFAAEEANAQTAECAEFDVFTPPTGTHKIAVATNPLSLDGTLAELVIALMADPGLQALNFQAVNYARQFHFGDTPGSGTAATGFSNGLPVFSGGVVVRGDIITLVDSGTSTVFDTYRVYENADMSLALAEEQAATKCITELIGDEFFLTDMWVHTTRAITTNMGYAAPTCIGNQVNVAGLLCADPICVGNQTVVAGVCTDPTCIGDQTLTDGVCVNPTCDAPQIVVEGVCSAPADCVAPQVIIAGVCSDPLEMSETPAATRTATSESNHSEYLIGGGLVFAGGLLFAIITKANGDEAEFTFSPDFNYAITESGYSANVGGRMDFAKDNWRLYWTARQTNANGDFGDFRYSSGGEYKADFWKAAFSESVQGETVDYDLSLSANWTGGIWKVSPAFAIDSVYEKGEFQTTNSFRISGELLVDDWHFSASGNQTQMQLSATLEF